MGAKVSRPIDNRPPPPPFDRRKATEFLDFELDMLGNPSSTIPSYGRNFFQNQLDLITSGDIGTDRTRIFNLGDQYDKTKMTLATFQIQANKYVDFYNYYMDLLDLYRPDNHYKSYKRKEEDLYKIGKKFYDFGWELYFNYRGEDVDLIMEFLRIVSYVMTNTDYDYSREWFETLRLPRVYAPEWEWEDAIIGDDGGLPGPKAAIKKK